MAPVVLASLKKAVCPDRMLVAWRAVWLDEAIRWKVRSGHRHNEVVSDDTEAAVCKTPLWWC